MAAAPRDSDLCAERSGFLFAHDCSRRASETCATCGKGVCEQHTHLSQEGAREKPLCTTCAKKVRRAEQRSRRDHDRRRYDRWDYPYFYGYNHYPGWGHYGRGHWGDRHLAEARHDPNDFTEADAQGLTGGEGSGLSPEVPDDFENDMGAS